MRALAWMGVMCVLTVAALPARAEEPATPAAVEAEDPIVCKRVVQTGTRLRNTRVCKPKSVWRKAEEDAKEFMKGVDQRSSIGVQDIGTRQGTGAGGGGG